MRVVVWGLLVISLVWVPAVRANVVGADTQNFNPITSGLDFVTVHSSETLQPGLFNLGFFLNYAVNTLPNYENITTAGRTNFTDTLLSADFNFGLGLTADWDMGVSFPFLLHQSVDESLTAFRGEFAETGLTEVRLNTKYRLWGGADEGLALVGSVNFNQIQDNPFSGVDPDPTFNFEVAADTTMGRYAFGANLGYRWRNPGIGLPGIPVEPLGDQWIGSAAVSYLLTEYDIKLIGELFGSVPAQESSFASDRDLSSLEVLGGMKMDLTPSLAFHAGGGTEVVHGTSSPDWRVYTGLNYVIGPVFAVPKSVIVRVDNKALDSLSGDTGQDPFAGAPGVKESFVARDVLFKFNSDEIQPEFRKVLQRLVDYLQRPPGIRSLTIEGHTDSIGSDTYNQRLSMRRAESVRREMISLGLPAAKVEALGYGESRPIADNGNFQGRALNRRVEFTITR